MYYIELRIIENGIEFYDNVWADNSREAIEIGEEKYPYADFVDVA